MAADEANGLASAHGREQVVRDGSLAGVGGVAVCVRGALARGVPGCRASVGPLAQRLEQGTHNPKMKGCGGVHGVAAKLHFDQA